MKNCLACAYRLWKSNISRCNFEILSLNYKPIIGIEKTNKFFVLSIIH